jgi:hypothetical protein
MERARLTWNRYVFFVSRFFMCALSFNSAIWDLDILCFRMCMCLSQAKAPVVAFNWENATEVVQMGQVIHPSTNSHIHISAFQCRVCTYLYTLTSQYVPCSLDVCVVQHYRISRVLFIFVCFFTVTSVFACVLFFQSFKMPADVSVFDMRMATLRSSSFSDMVCVNSHQLLFYYYFVFVFCFFLHVYSYHLSFCVCLLACVNVYACLRLSGVDPI